MKKKNISLRKNGKRVTKTLFETSIDMLSEFILWLLIWVGSVLSLINSGEIFLAVLLLFSGFAWVYKDAKKLKGEWK